MKFYVYQLIDPRNDQVFYIGCGQKDRMYNHEKEVLAGRIPNKRNKKLGNKIKKILSFGLEIDYKKVFITDNGKEAFIKEKELIAEIGLNHLCNLTDGGRNGYTYSVEVKRKMSEFKIGKSRLPFSEEHKRKISEANKGKTGGPHNKGRTFTADHKQKIADSVKKYWKNK